MMLPSEYVVETEHGEIATVVMCPTQSVEELRSRAVTAAHGIAADPSDYWLHGLLPGGTLRPVCRGVSIGDAQVGRMTELLLLAEPEAA